MFIVLIILVSNIFNSNFLYANPVKTKESNQFHHDLSARTFEELSKKNDSLFIKNPLGRIIVREVARLGVLKITGTSQSTHPIQYSFEIDEKNQAISCEVFQNGFPSGAPQELDIIVEVSSDYLKHLSLMTEEGEIIIEGRNSDRSLAKSFTLSSMSGDIIMDGIHAHHISLKTSSGLLSIKNSIMTSIKAHAESGQIELHQIAAAEEINIASEKGEVRLTKTKSKKSRLQADNGKIVISGHQGNSSLISDGLIIVDKFQGPWLIIHGSRENIYMSNVSPRTHTFLTDSSQNKNGTATRLTTCEKALFPL
jgi:formylmethanofuran dehydrogenase subunit C